MQKNFSCLFMCYSIYLKVDKLEGKLERVINIQNVDCYPGTNQKLRSQHDSWGIYL